ncbi:MAG TPA: malto-oligosyltrehalose synthase [Candidatus Limnocylindrales bacterium]|nr:malto-oligosyltrehalose synthase [Candidatus Limnocylindrales bacterium]
MPGTRGRRVPRATYRVQLNAGFTLDDAAALVPYLAELGISHLYTSPVLQAAPGSNHGYDVVDHSRVSAELGGAEAFERLTDALRANGMGLVLDIVPNHMAISGEENQWWWDVLEHGKASTFASHFDVDLDAPIVLPVLTDDDRNVLEMGGIRLVRDGERLLIGFGARRVPLDPRTVAPILAASDVDTLIAEFNADPQRLEALLARQHYRLASWRAALTDLRYRRFFDVNDLIGLRVEDEAVYMDVHRLALDWVERGIVDGLRVDHPDGLRDPAGYLARLRADAPDAWIVVEKILETDEDLPDGWPVEGTTGYRFANLATGLFVDPDGEHAMSETWASAGDAGPGWEETAADSRADVLSSLLGSDIDRLTGLLMAVPQMSHHAWDELRAALRELAARLPVYRTYLTSSPRCASDGDAVIIERTVAAASAARPDLDPELFDRLGRVLLLEVDDPMAVELAIRFQQLTPAAMAKGVEDTAFYRYLRLVALNEVGGDPGRFGISVASFHRHMERAAADWPEAMLSLSTHDTKRGADVRARLAVLSEDPAGWRQAVERLGNAAEPHRSRESPPTAADAYLLFQTLVGAWPIDAGRAAAYMLKATREAKLRTSWLAPNAPYEEAMDRFVRGALGDPRFVEVVESVVAPLVDAGRRAALGQVALELTAPGVPDLYQGDELWQLALVDPDNRRPVDYDGRRHLLARARDADAAAAWEGRDDGLAKLWLVRHALDLRRRHEASFVSGRYRPIGAEGALADAVVSFERGGNVMTVVPRLVRRVERLGWSDTRLALPSGRWRNLDGVEHTGTVGLGALLSDFPVALLERVG